MLRAVGATRRTIIGLILAESTLQGVVGTAIGLVLGYGFASALASVIGGLLDQFMRVRVSGSWSRRGSSRFRLAWASA